MAFGTDDKKFEYHVDADRVFDEKGSTFLALRKVAWGCSQNETPELGKSRWELRRWRIRDEKEMADKGFSFLTEDGPHELTNALLSEGFGHTAEVLDILKTRDDFRDAVENMSVDRGSNGDYFDPRTMLLQEDE